MTLLDRATEAKNKISDIKKMSLMRKGAAVEDLVDDLSNLLIDVIKKIEVLDNANKTS